MSATIEQSSIHSRPARGSPLIKLQVLFVEAGWGADQHGQSSTVRNSRPDLQLAKTPRCCCLLGQVIRLSNQRHLTVCIATHLRATAHANVQPGSSYTDRCFTLEMLRTLLGLQKAAGASLPQCDRVQQPASHPETGVRYQCKQGAVTQNPEGGRVRSRSRRGSSMYAWPSSDISIRLLSFRPTHRAGAKRVRRLEAAGQDRPP